MLEVLVGKERDHWFRLQVEMVRWVDAVMVV